MFKTITIKLEVYETLKKLKRENESFSDLLLRLANQVNGQKLERFLGSWKIDDNEFNMITNQIDKLKKDHKITPVNFD